MKIYKYILIATLLLSFFGNSAKKDNRLNLFIWFLFLGEVLISEALKRTVGANLIFYNFFAPMTALFYIYFFSRRNLKDTFSLILCLIVVYVVIGLVTNLDWYKSMNALGYLALLSVAFYKIVKVFLSWLDEPPEHGLLQEPKFWLGLGVLLFTACSFPILAFANPFIVSGDAKMAFSKILAIGNIILYLGYLMAIIATTKWIRYIG